MSGEFDAGSPTLKEMVSHLHRVDVRRIHVLAWRDLMDPEAGGSEIHADEFMRRWQEAGLDIVHRTSLAKGQPEVDRRHGYEVVRRGGRIGVFPRTIAAEVLGRMGRRDALVEIWNGVPWLTPMWCRQPRLLILHHVHDEMWNQILPRPLAWLGRSVETSWAPKFYRRTPTVALCEDTRYDLLELGWPGSNVHIASAGVDPFFSEGGRKTRHPSLLAVGRLAPVKRFIDLLEQFALVHAQIPEARLTLIGEGSERDRLQAWLRDHHMEHAVRLLGRVDKETLRDHYRESWLIVSASLAEGWGLTLTEAAGCGTPAVATDIGGHRSSILDGQTGVLAPLEKLGATCVEILNDGARREKLGARARDRAATLSWDQLAADVLRPLYEDIRRRA